MMVYTYFPEYEAVNQYNHIPGDEIIDLWEPLVGGQITMVDWDYIREYLEKETCPKCKGKGKVRPHPDKSLWPCDMCGGSGFRESPEKDKKERI